MKQKRYFLSEAEIPQQWYNIQAEMPGKPLPMLDPKTLKPVTVEGLSTIFCEECSRQELNFTDKWIDIPEEVREMYTYYRSTPLVRAYGLEKALDSPSISPILRITILAKSQSPLISFRSLPMRTTSSFSTSLPEV